MQMGVFEAIDEMGAGVTTRVTRFFEARGAVLEVSGIWTKCWEARQMAMLALYQVGCSYLLHAVHQ